MSRWFRVYDDLVDDPKVQRLPAETFRGLINLWCLASNNGGILPPHDEIAFKLRLSPQKATKLLDDLVAAGLLEHDDRGVFPHNWDGRQHKSDVSNERVKRHRERKRNADVTLHPPLPKRPQSTETETDNSVANATGGEPPKVLSPADQLWMEGPEKLMGLGAKERDARVMIGKWMRDGHGPESVHSAIDAAVKAGTGDPTSYVTRILKPAHPNGAHHGPYRKPSASDFARARLAELEQQAREDGALLRIAGH